MNHRKSLLAMMTAEFERQDTKWGYPQLHGLFSWLAVIGEEYGEACQAVLQAGHSGCPGLPEPDYSPAVAELVQTACCCIQMADFLVGQQGAGEERQQAPIRQCGTCIDP